MPRYEELRKRRTRVSPPAELEVLFSVLNEGRYELPGIGLFDSGRYCHHGLLRLSLWKIMLGYLAAQSRDGVVESRLVGRAIRLVRAQLWTPDGRWACSRADRLLAHQGEDARLNEDTAAASARHHIAVATHRLAVGFLEHKEVAAYRCVARCVREDCQVRHPFDPFKGGRWFLAMDDRQVYCDSRCANAARSRRYRSSRS